MRAITYHVCVDTTRAAPSEASSVCARQDVEHAGRDMEVRRPVNEAPLLAPQAIKAGEAKPTVRIHAVKRWPGLLSCNNGFFRETSAS